MKAAVLAESYILSIIFHRHLYSPAMSTASNQVGAALFPSFELKICDTSTEIIDYKQCYDRLISNSNILFTAPATSCPRSIVLHSRVKQHVHMRPLIM